MRTERPPRLWNLSVGEDEVFFRLLGETIAHGLTRGNELADLTLKADNIVVEHDDGLTEPGDYIGITVLGPNGDWHPEQRWPVDADTNFVNADLHDTAAQARLTFGYARAYPEGGGSITLFFAASRS